MVDFYFSGLFIEVNRFAAGCLLFKDQLSVFLFQYQYHFNFIKVFFEFNFTFFKQFLLKKN